MKIFTIPTMNAILDNNEIIESTDFTICMSGSQIEAKKGERTVFTNHYYLDTQESTLTAISPYFIGGIIIPNIFRKDIPVRVKLDDEGYKMITDMMFKMDDERYLIGEYPQTVASKEISSKLSCLYSINQLETTGKSYYFYFDKNQDCFSESNKEYFYNGKKYVLIDAQNNGNKPLVLSSGQRIKKGEKVWIEVEPVYFRKVNGEWLSEKLLFSGISPFFTNNEVGGFEESNINRYLNTFFIENLIPSALILLKKAEKETLSESEILTVISFLKQLPENSIYYARHQASKFGEDYLAYFDSLWINGDLSRAKLISSLKRTGTIHI